MPPRAVRMPLAACMPWMSSGLVSTRTRMTDFAASARAVPRYRHRTPPCPWPHRARLAGRLRQHIARGLGIERRVQQAGRAPSDRRGATASCLVDQAFARHVDRHLERGLGGALARAGLQHPQLALLDGELDVLHVAVMLFEQVEHARQFGIGPASPLPSRAAWPRPARARPWSGTAACGCRRRRPRPAR